MTNFREMINNRKLFILIAFLSFLANSFAQVTIKSLPYSKDILGDSVFLDKSSTRVTQLLNENWKVYSEENSSNIIKTSIPASFIGNETIVYETTITFTKEELETRMIKLGFLGINYTTEILLNNLSIYKRASGEIPFEIELPQDILKADTPNKIKIKVNSLLDSENTIPVLQRFLFPSIQQGITRDVFLKILPISNLSDIDISPIVDKNLSNARVGITLSLGNINSLKKSLGLLEALTLKIKLKPKNKLAPEYKYETIVSQLDKDELNTSLQFEIQNPILWSPDSPTVYSCEIGLYNGTQLIDVTKKEFTFLSIAVSEQSITLNNQPFHFNGTTYFLNETELSNINVYQKLASDLGLIKNIGFNAVRFSKAYPHPYALKLCRELGLLALIELPLNSVPEEILDDSDFQVRTAHRIKEVEQQYLNFSNTFLLGLGSSYLPNSPLTEEFISYLLNSLDRNGIITYASFYGIQKGEIENLDLYGIELFTRTSDDTRNFLLGIDNNAKYFLSEVSYPNYLGSASGYLVQNSTEAQAKFLENTITISEGKKIGGFFINTLFNYIGGNNSFFAGYSKHNYYSLGILKPNSSTNSLSYKLLHSKFENEGKVTIPIGTSKDENKLMFIILALALSIIMAIIINTRKQFREDCTRALFKPYNFYADLRDHRIISSTHTFILLLVESGSASLLFTVLLFYLRTNILLEKILLSFGNPNIVNIVSELAWHPEKCFFYLFFALVVKIVVLSIVIKIASYSLKTRVEFAGIFYSVVWALLPFTLLLPVELILYKILAAYGMNIFTIVFLILFMLWILQRLLKGIHVIFDVQPLPVYIYSLLLILVSVGGIALYYQLTNSTLYYISNAIKQYNSTPF